MDHNPFLQRGQREEDQTPSLPDPENPFTSAQGRAAISATAGLVNSSTPAQREGAQRLATHVVKKGCSIGFGSVWLPGCCGGESSRVKVRWHLLMLVCIVLTFFNTMRHSFSLNSIFLTLAGVPLLFLAVLANQIGQLVMLKAHGGTPSHIVLWHLGGMVPLHSPTMSLGARARIALAGPATHVRMVPLKPVPLNLHPSPPPNPTSTLTPTPTPTPNPNPDPNPTLSLSLTLSRQDRLRLCRAAPPHRLHERLPDVPPQRLHRREARPRLPRRKGHGRHPHLRPVGSAGNTREGIRYRPLRVGGVAAGRKSRRAES